MEKLRAYLASTGMKQKDFAAKAGIGPSYLHDLLSGRREPSLATAGKIAAATRGKVPLSAWLVRSKDLADKSEGAA